MMAILLTGPGSGLVITLPVRSNEMVCNDHVGDDPYDTIQERRYVETKQEIINVFN